MIASTNPATGETFARFEAHHRTAIEARLEAARCAQETWRWVPLDERTALLRRLARLLRAQNQPLAALITREMGKPIGEALAEVEKCAHNCEFYAEAAHAMLADAPIADLPGSFVACEPIGVILAIMPWNYPLWQVIRFLAPTLAAGNGAILKHAANVPQCALALERLVAEAGGAAGLLTNVFVEPDAAAGLIADPRIAGVTLTGSTQVGMIVAAQAGAALKKQVLELGGSDPFVVLADTDIETAATAAVAARFTNAGQSCVNAKRFIVERAVADCFADALVEKAQALRMGDPADATTGIGPLARANLRTAIHDQVERSVDSGARLLTGGQPAAGAGFFYPPTVLDHVEPGMAAFDEETFGPAAAIVRADDAESAIALANRTAFGLGASVWTADIERGAALARRLEAGLVFVNAVVASDPRAPFGGIKHSGYGRELGELGLKEFTNAKTIRIVAPGGVAAA